MFLRRRKIILYTIPECPYCRLLEKFLTEHNIKFRNIDVSNNKKLLKKVLAKVGQAEQAEVPIININGQIIIGFDKEKISKILGLRD